jgi:hypothetical protein
VICSTGRDASLHRDKNGSRRHAGDIEPKRTADARQEGRPKSRGVWENAVRLDPTFAAAWALLAQENAHRYFNHIDKPVTGLAARVALEKAMRLQPDTPETLVAEGYYFYWVEGNYEVASRVLLQVRSKWPIFIDAPVALGRIARREGNVQHTALLWTLCRATSKQWN